MAALSGLSAGSTGGGGGVIGDAALGTAGRAMGAWAWFVVATPSPAGAAGPVVEVADGGVWAGALEREGGLSAGEATLKKPYCGELGEGPTDW